MRARSLSSRSEGEKLTFFFVPCVLAVGYIYTPVTGQVATTSSASGPLTSDPFWGVVASCAFVATQWYKSPPAVTIVGGALAGLAWFGVVGPAGVERQQLVRG